MGVHGLWQLLHPSGRPVTLESLEGKVLAVDVSIWLHQSMKGMRDKDGNSLPNAHLQGLFSRVCKLLFYRIKPVFVFDGGIPDLKKEILAARRQKKSEASKEKDEISKKLLQNLIKSQAVKQALRVSSGGSGPPIKVPGVSKRDDSDLFQLAPLPEAQEVGLALNAEAWDADFDHQDNWIMEGLASLSKVDPDSKEFKSLPMEIQHEALVDLKEERKYHALKNMSKMPEDADSFSSYQLKKLMKVSNLTTRIDAVRRELSNPTVDLRNEMGGDYRGDTTESRRIVSENEKHYILVKGLSKQKQLEEAERYELERKIKIEKQEAKDEEDEETGEEDIIEEPSEGSPSSSTKRPMKEKGKHVARKRMKYNQRKGEGNTKQSLKKGALLSTAINDHNNDDSDDDESSGKEGQDESENSSSEDEGFIEVTIDTNQAVEEDDLFPASIFATNTDTIADADKLLEQEKSANETALSNPNSKSSGVKDNLHHNVKSVSSRRKKKSSQNSVVVQKERVDDVKISSSVTSGGVEEKEDMAEKRKTVLSDILAELKKQKETLESLSADVGDVDLKERNNEDEEIMGKGIDDEEHLSGGSGDRGDVRKNEDDERKVIEEEDSLPGGFIREVGDSDDEDGYFGKSKGDSGKSGSIFDKIRKAVIESDDENGSDGDEKRRAAVESDGEDGSDGDNTIASRHEGRINDSEDEDLKLAIELSLQTANQEKSKKKRKKAISDSEDESSEVASVESPGDKVKADDRDDNDDDDDFQMVEAMAGGEDNAQEFSVSSNNNNIGVADEYDDNRGGGANSDDELLAAEELGPLPITHKPRVVHISPVKTSGQEKLQPEDVVDPFMEFQQSNLQNIREELAMERSGLMSEHGRHDRFATSLTDKIVMEAQELLTMFGIPYIVCPMEAEAQCAFLDATRQTQGTITDDSDIWLFGGTRVYKNFFNQSKFVEFFSVDSIVSHFGLTREQLIKIALLCGSDYTTGIPGVGPVRALEIMGEFQGEGLAGLMTFRKWWDLSKKKPAVPGENKLKTRLRDVTLDKGFPNKRVMEAYLSPAVDESREEFSWGQPDLDLLRHFARVKFGWAREKSDSILDPMMKQLLKKKTQGRIESYFKTGSYVPSSTATAHSDRVKKALSAMQGTTSPSKDEARQGQTNNASARKRRNGDKSEEGVDDGAQDKNKTSEKKKTNKKKKKNEKQDDSISAGTGADEEKGKAAEDGKRKGSDLGEKESNDSVTGGFEGVRVKTEVCSDDEKKQRIRKDVQEKVVKGSSVLAKGAAAKKREGGGGGGKSKRGGRVTANTKIIRNRGSSNVPSLEKKWTKSQRGKQFVHSAAVKRVVVDLSESSSDDNEDGGEVKGKHEEYSMGFTDNVNIAHFPRTVSEQRSVIGNKNMNRDDIDRTSQHLDSSKPDMLREKQAGEEKRSLVDKFSSPDADFSVMNRSEAEDASDENGVKKIPRKNPDVSLINAVTLKATLSYLNQRTSGEKNLLNALKGNRPTNAVERRLEEEEKRGKRGIVDHLSSEVAGSPNRKEMKKSEKEKQSGPKPSFEDMLGETEVLLTAKSSKLKSNKTKSEKSSVDKEIAEDDSGKSQKARGREKDRDVGVHGDSGSGVSKGRAVAGKGKGIGKNRSGKQSHQQGGDGGADNVGAMGGKHAATTKQDRVSSVLASSGVTDAEIMEYGKITLDDFEDDF